MGVQLGREVLQIAVVRKHPVAAPQLAHKGVAVLQADHALGGLADVGDDVLALDGVATDQLGHRRVDGAFMVHKQPQALVLEECNAPAIGVIAGVARALCKAAEAKTHIGGRVAVHS